jgi:hypothetical protein
VENGPIVRYFVFFNIFINILAAESSARLQLCSSWWYISFALLFWAAGGQIDFWREGTINL